MEVIGGIKLEGLIKTETINETEAVDITIEDIQDDFKIEKNIEKSPEISQDLHTKKNGQPASLKRNYSKDLDDDESNTNTYTGQEKLIMNYGQEGYPESRKKKFFKQPKNDSVNLQKRIEQYEFTLFTSEKVNQYRCNHCLSMTSSKETVLKHIRENHRDMAIFSERKEKLKKLASRRMTKYVAWYEYILVGDNLYRCNHCQDLIKDRPQADKHVREKHRKGNTIYNQCPLCIYKTRNSLARHTLLIHTEEKDINYFKCDKCDYKSKTKNGIRKHILRKHTDPSARPVKMHRCVQCPKIYKERTALRRHIEHFHNPDTSEKFKCFNCPYECWNKHALEHHIESRHMRREDLKTLQCPQCPFKTKYKSRIRAHINLNHKSVYQCHICSYQCTNSPLIKLHLIGHKKIKEEKDLKYCCDKCEYKTYRMYSLQVHKLNHLKPEEIQYFYCYHCNFKAKRKDNLKTHVLRHFKHDEVSLACFVCEFTTQKRHILIRHLDNHSKEANKEKNAKLKVFKIDNKHLERKKQASKITDRDSKEEKI